MPHMNSPGPVISVISYVNCDTKHLCWINLATLIHFIEGRAGWPKWGHALLGTEEDMCFIRKALACGSYIMSLSQNVIPGPCCDLVVKWSSVCVFQFVSNGCFLYLHLLSNWPNLGNCIWKLLAILCLQCMRTMQELILYSFKQMFWSRPIRKTSNVYS